MERKISIRVSFKQQNQCVICRWVNEGGHLVIRQFWGGKGKFNCSSPGQHCAGVILQNGWYINGTDPTWFSMGQIVFFQFQNDINSVHHVAFWVDTIDKKRVTPTYYAPAKGGNNYGYFTSQGGYYILKVACQGGEDDRCSGEGMIYNS